MGAHSARHVSAFRAFRTRLRDAFEQFHGSLVSIDVLLTWGTSNFAVIRVRNDPRLEGNSNYNFAKLIRHAFNMITGFSTLPLKLASILGFVFSLFGMAVLSYVLLRFVLNGSPVAGFPFLASIIAIFSGVQLFSLGIFGEYLSRMHFRILEKPSYTIKDVV
jgi:undecaprenyl-phosphate 4-deoxy-4-formamido-L-arabinose transferase